MSIRVDTTSLISGAVVCGNRGLGVLGSTILTDTSTGDHGAGYLFNDVEGGDSGKEFRGLIVTPPSAGNFFAHEDGSFSLVAPDGAYTFIYRLYADGADLGTATASVTIGASSAASLSISMDASAFAGGAFVSPVAGIGIVTDASVFSGIAGSGALAAIGIVTDASVFAGGAFVSPIATFDLTAGNSVFLGAASVSSGIAYWPTPDKVQYGVQYGPSGAEYTGTLTGGSGPSAAEIAAAVRSDLAAELAQLTKVSKLHGIGVDLVVTPTSRTAGSVAQTISTSGDSVTVSAA